MEDKQITTIRSFHKLSTSSLLSLEAKEAGEAEDNLIEKRNITSKTEEQVSSSDKENDTNCSSSCNNEGTRETCQSNTEKVLLQGLHGDAKNIVKGEGSASDGSFQGDCGRERLKRHRVEVAGTVWIPDIWGQEELLKDWIDCSAFDASIVSNRIMSARTALVQEGRRANSSGLSITNSC